MFTLSDYFPYYVCEPNILFVCFFHAVCFLLSGKKLANYIQTDLCEGGGGGGGGELFTYDLQ